MKKSGRKLAIAAILAGAVVVSANSCQQNVAVYGPPEDFGNEANSAETSEVSSGEASNDEASDEFNPDDNMIEDVYGPPMEYETD